MIFRRPPALAEWLLDRFGNARRNPALAGDLDEEFRNGRSAGWYWRQTLVVVANSVARDMAAMAPYLWALGAAYAVGLAVTLTLWWRQAPCPVHGGDWTKFGVWLAFQLAGCGYTALVNRLAVGASFPDIKQMYCAVESVPRRQIILALAAYQSFSLGLGNYVLCALLFPRFSLPVLLGVEVAWFGLWIFMPALTSPTSTPAADAQKVEDQEPWLAIQQTEPIVSVVLSNGRTVTLAQQSLAQSVFATADRTLITTVFGKRRSLELVRRAILLAGFRTNSHIEGRAETLTIAELNRLIDQTARSASVWDAFYARESFRQRLSRAFRGDPA